MVDFGDPEHMLFFASLAETEDFLVGDLFPMNGEDGAAAWRVAETHRRDTLGADGAIERDWVLNVEPAG